MKTEEWKDIGVVKGIDFTGLYQVSNYGLVKSLNYNNTGREQVLRPNMDEDGYLIVCLSKDGKQKSFRINRLVAIAFELPIPEELKHLPLERLEADHIDTDKTNNCVWNLRWTDSKGNMRNPLTRQHISEALKGIPKSEEAKRKMSEAKKGKHLTDETKRKMSESRINGKLSKRVLQHNKETGEVIREWPSLAEVYRQLGYSQGYISACCNGKYKSSYGFKWSYA